MAIRDSTSDRNPVERLAEEFAERHRRGEHPTVKEYTDKHPELADEIRDLFPALLMMERIKPAAEVSTGPPERPSTLADSASRPTSPLPEQLGQYRILRVIGEGGMGIVYEAEHESLKKPVALKVMHKRFRTDETSLKRFRREARAVAGLQHTNIVPVFDFGEQDGILFYAMQYIQGFGLDQVLDDVRRLRAEVGAAVAVSADGAGDIAAIQSPEALASAVTRGLLTGRFATEADTPADSDAPTTAALKDDSPEPIGFQVANGPPPSSPSAVENRSSASLHSGNSELTYFREVARLGLQIADALDYSHHHEPKVIHRDIKPSNLLLDARGNVWVTDFGLAKLIEGDGDSASRDVAGTLRFMAPERFRGVSDPQGDVYALGATLYEMLTFRPAFPEKDQVELIRQIAEEPPKSLCQHDPRIPRDLETIVLRVLSKEPKDRCNRAGELRDEIRRFLEGRPTRWRRVGPAEQLRRWCKRNPVIAVLSGSLAAVLLLFLAWAWVANFRLSRALSESSVNFQKREIAERQMVRQLIFAFEAKIAQARASRQSRRAGQRFATLEVIKQARDLLPRLELAPDEIEPQRLRLRNEAIAALALPDLRKVIGHPEWSLHNVDYDGRLERCAVDDGDKKSIDIYLAGDGTHLIHLDTPSGGFYPRFSRDGRRLYAWTETGALRAWDLEGATPRVVIDEPAGALRGFPTLSADGERLAYVTRGGSCLLVNLRTGERRTLPVEPGRHYFASFSPDGRRFALGTIQPDGRSAFRLQGLERSEPGQTWLLPPGLHPWQPPEWSPDGRRLAVGLGGNIYIWTIGTPDPVVLNGHKGAGISVAFNHRGDLLASNSWSRELSLWDPRSGERLLMLGDAGNYTHPPRFSPDDKRVASGPEVYDVASRHEFRRFMPPNTNTATDGIRSRARLRSQDGRLLAVNCNDSSFELFDFATGDLLAALPLDGKPGPVFDRHGDILCYTGTIGLIRWPIRARSDEATAYEIGPPEILRHEGRPDTAVAVSPVGQHIGLTDRHEGALLLHLGPPRRVIRLNPGGDVRDTLDFSPDGRWVVTGNFSSGGKGELHVWEVATGRLVHSRATGSGTRSRFDPFGRRLWFEGPGVKSSTLAVGTWDDLRPSVIKGWSPDGRMGLGLEARAQSLHDAATGKELSRLEDPSDDRIEYAFTPDGDHLLGHDVDSPAICAWDLRLLRERLRELELDWDAPALSRGLTPEPAIPPRPITVTVIGAERVAEAAKLRREASQHEQSGQMAEAMQAYASLLALFPDHPVALNNLAWQLATGPPGLRDPARAVALAKRVVDLSADSTNVYLNTLGVALYRAARYDEAAPVLERSLVEGRGASDAFDLFFLAMARHRLGEPARARADFDRALQWMREHPPQSAQWAQDLSKFRAEAEAVLAGPASELPANVFAPADGP